MAWFVHARGCLSRSSGASSSDWAPVRSWSRIPILPPAERTLHTDPDCAGANSNAARAHNLPNTASAPFHKVSEVC
jgi:hypothetical protein